MRKETWPGRGFPFDNIFFPDDGLCDRGGCCSGCGGDCGWITCDFISIRETFHVAPSIKHRAATLRTPHMTHSGNCVQTSTSPCHPRYLLRSLWPNFANNLLICRLCREGSPPANQRVNERIQPWNGEESNTCLQFSCRPTNHLLFCGNVKDGAGGKYAAHT